MERAEICGTCIHHEYLQDQHGTGTWYCCNEDSECYSLETEHEDKCFEWEGRDAEMD